MHCSLLISGFEFHHRVGRMPTRSSTSFTPCLFNGTLCCLVMGQSSAILLFQLVCLKGSLWLSMEGLLSVTRKSEANCPPGTLLFFSAKSQHPHSRFLHHFYDPQLRVRQHGCLYWKTRKINPGTLQGQRFIVEVTELNILA